MDAALLARSARRLASLGGARAALVLLGLALGAARRRHRKRHLDRWLDGVRGDLSVSVDGRRETGSTLLPADARKVSVDVFLRAKPGQPRPPGPGPTLVLVLSQNASNTTLRLTPVRDVRGDAVRTRLKDDTLARVLARPGTWRLEARLDGRAVAEHRLEVEVEAPRAGPARRLLHLVGRA